MMAKFFYPLLLSYTLALTLLPVVIALSVSAPNDLEVDIISSFPGSLKDIPQSIQREWWYRLEIH